MKNVKLFAILYTAVIAIFALALSTPTEAVELATLPTVEVHTATIGALSFFSLPKLMALLFEYMPMQQHKDIQQAILLDYVAPANNDKEFTFNFKDGSGTLANSKNRLSDADLFIALYTRLGFQEGVAGTKYYSAGEVEESGLFDTNQEATYRSLYSNGHVTLEAGNQPIFQNLQTHAFEAKNHPDNAHGTGRASVYVPTVPVVVGGTDFTFRLSMDTNADVDVWVGGTDTTQYYLFAEVEGVVIKNGRKLLTEVANWTPISVLIDALGR